MARRGQPYIRKAYGFGGRVGKKRRRSIFDTLPIVPMLLVAAGLGGLATTGLRDTGLSEWLLSDRPAAGATASRSFDVCSGSVRVTCVVDGDTFWLEGTRIRIADINTPEIGQPECTAEAALGRQATSRLAALLSDGPFTLAKIDRDEDQYGRKLRIVEREGRSVGMQLVAEGLAHEWRGRREGWC